MRAKITIRADIALLLERLCRERDQSFEEVVHQALAHGVDQMVKREPFQTRAVDLGPLLHASVKEALRVLDEETDRRKLGLL